MGKLCNRGRKLKNIQKEFASDRPIYERQPTESDRAFLAFSIYRDAGVSRSVRTCVKDYIKASEIKNKSEASTFHQMNRWSAQWRWRERIVEYDRFLDMHRRKLALKEIEQMRSRHVKLAEALQNLGAKELKKYLKKLEKENDDAEITISIPDLMRVLDAGVKLERSSRGEPESIIEERHEISSSDKRNELRALLLDDEATKAIDSLLKKKRRNDADDANGL